MTTVLLMATALYVAFVAMLYFSQNRMLFLPHIPGRMLDSTPAVIGLEYEQVTLTTADGIELDGWFIASQSPGPTLLFFHGNAGNISHRLDSIHIFHELGLNVFIFDYRGYGRSTGKPSERGVYRDAESAWHYLTVRRAITPSRIILFGRSLGGAITAWLAARTNPGAVIIESTFTSVPDMAAKLYPLVPVRLLARLEFNALDVMHDITSPVLIIHSREDEIIPFDHGQALYQKAPSPKDFIELSGGHNDGFILSGNIYVQGLKRFLTKSFNHIETW